MNRILLFIKREAVLCTALLCAVLSMLAVPPSAAYLGYIDLRVLGLLFCLMTVVQGFQSCGLFDLLAHRLVSGRKDARIVILELVLLPFFCAMLVTNDVALITFVPFTILIMKLTGRVKSLPWVITLQTLAANLGSIATPVGNPQNLFLYEFYALPLSGFFSCVLPVAAASLLILTAAVILSERGTVEVVFPEPARIRDPGLLALSAGLFLLSLLSVFRVLNYLVPVCAVLAGFLAFKRKLLLRVDYSLLLTFVCFFIIAGNLGSTQVIRTFLTAMLSGRTLLASVLASQLISNVPAAVLLSGFTENWRSLLLGVDIGGMGTVIASLASLISLKLYIRSDCARPWKYLGMFTLANLAGLLLFIPLAALLS